MVFLDASDDVIVRRFKETRRRHTLENGTGLRNSITHEREIIGEIRSLADKVLNTDALTVHQLVDWTKTQLSQIEKYSLSVTLMSFGFKYGLPVELDMCFDVRFIENPYFVPELKLLNGLDRSVSQFVLSRPGAQEFLSRVTELIQYLIPLYQQEGKNYLTIGIGCTGGQHRSPAIAVAINELLSSTIVRVEHRNLN